MKKLLPTFLALTTGLLFIGLAPAAYSAGPASPPAPALPVLGASIVGLLASPFGQGPLVAASALVPGRDTAADSSPGKSVRTRKGLYKKRSDPWKRWQQQLEWERLHKKWLEQRKARLEPKPGATKKQEAVNPYLHGRSNNRDDDSSER